MIELQFATTRKLLKFIDSFKELNELYSVGSFSFYSKKLGWAPLEAYRKDGHREVIIDMVGHHLDSLRAEGTIAFELVLAMQKNGLCFPKGLSQDRLARWYMTWGSWDRVRYTDTNRFSPPFKP